MCQQVMSVVGFYFCVSPEEFRFDVPVNEGPEGVGKSSVDSGGHADMGIDHLRNKTVPCQSTL